MVRSQLVVLVDKVVKQLVQGRAAHLLRGIVDANHDVALLHDYGHDALVVHEETGQEGGVEYARELELAMHHLARIDALQLLILDGLQVEFATVERRDRRGSLDVIGFGTRRNNCDYSKYVEYSIHRR